MVNGTMTQSEYERAIDEMPEDVLQYMAQAFAPWQSPSMTNGQTPVDEDGFPQFSVSLDNFHNFSHMQKTCWEKYQTNPHLNSHVRDIIGSLTGYGFGVGSDIQRLDDFIYDITYDPRNELYKNLPKYVGRSEIEGELFLAFTVHVDGFVEVDFLPPSSLTGDGDYNSGIYFHPSKGTMPLFYSFNLTSPDGKNTKQVIPSIYMAHYPELMKIIPEKWKITPNLLKTARKWGKTYKSVGNFKTFIVAWDKGLLTPRNLSHITTTIEWINHYINLKKWEIDHKKSAGAYLWVVRITDTKAFRTWLKLTKEQKAETGLTAKKTPGGTIILPPGVELDVKNPQLPNISEQDTDIMHMITSGLNKPEDMVTGQTKGDTFSGIKASRGPQADRTQDQIAAFERFLRYDFWRAILLLKSKMDKKFKLQEKVRKAVKFDEKGEPIFKNVNSPVWELLDFDFPTSEVSDLEAKARALLGVKHPSVSEVLGIPKGIVAKKLGFGRYRRLRLEYATEEDTLPTLKTTAELEHQQAVTQEVGTEPKKQKDDGGDDE